MESPASTVRRRGWINSSRQWLTVEDTDADTQRCSLPFASIADDDVFSDGPSNSPGCFTGKIENWLLTCGTEASSEKACQLSFDSTPKVGNIDDELGLGADACAVNEDNSTHDAGLAQPLSTSQRRSRLTSSKARRELHLPSLSLGHSMGSSCFSSSTWNTTSSISEVLKVYSEDAEETLYELGFGCEEPQVTVRIPPRFFTFPSQAQGINFRLFLDAQLRRIHEEDPSLSLASRFRQVQVLTAMANAFYSLYSHVSRIPVQKLPTPEFTFSSPMERFERFRSSVRSEPRSPVDRLKDTVSKMCLYTGSPRESDSVSPQPSPAKRFSLPDVVDIVLDKVKPGHIKKLDLGGGDENSSSGLCSDGDICLNTGLMEQIQHSQNGNTEKEIVDSEEAEVISADSQPFSSTSEPESGSNQRTVELKPLAKFSHDHICPQIVESVHKAPFCSQYRQTDETESTDPSCLESHFTHLPSMPLPGMDSSGPVDFSSSKAEKQVDESQTLPLSAAKDTCCSITVTTDNVSPSPLNVQDSWHSQCVPLTKTHKKTSHPEKSLYLTPVAQHISSHLQQVNSFELEEVHSAGEEDSVHSESRKKAAPKSTTCLFTGELVRGDSMQSDSSGYADEDASPSDRSS